MVLRHLLQSGSIFGVLLFATLRPICLPIPRLIGYSLCALRSIIFLNVLMQALWLGLYARRCKRLISLTLLDFLRLDRYSVFVRSYFSSRSICIHMGKLSAEQQDLR